MSNFNKIAYKKEGDEIKNKCRGYQTLSSQHHPVVLRSEEMKKILSDVSQLNLQAIWKWNLY